MAPVFWRQLSRPTARPLVALVLSAVFFTRTATVARAQGSWTTETSLPTKTQEVSVAGLNGIMYVIAGSLNQVRTNAAWAFDPATHVWTVLTPYPGAARDHAALATVGNQLYLIGGVTAWPQPSVSTVNRYDPSAGAWSVASPLPVARGATGVAVLNGKIYVAGGLVAGVSVADFTVYDPGTDTWTTLPSMLTARDHLAGAALNGKFYAICGRNNGQPCSPLSVVEIYDPSTNAWSAGTSMLTGHAGHAVGSANGRIQIFGGEGAASTCGTIAASEIFDPIANAWSAGTSMPTPRHGAGGATINGSVYIPGGGVWTGDSATNAHERFDDNGTSTIGPVPNPWSHQDIGAVGLAGGAAYNNGTFVSGAAGADIWGPADSFHYVYQTMSGDSQILARVVSLGFTSQFAKAGVMVRETLAPESRHVLLNSKPDGTLEFMTRSTTGGSTTFLTGGTLNQPTWLRLVRAGTLFTASISSNGTNWTPVGTTSLSLPATVYVGLAVASHTTSAMTSASFDNVSAASASGNVPPSVTLTSPTSGAAFTAPATVTLAAIASDSDGTVTRVDFYANNTPIGTSTIAPYGGTWSNVPPGSYTLVAVATDNGALQTTSSPASIVVSGSTGLPSPWNDQDIGSVGVAGSATISGGVFTVQGAGADIWGAADAFNFLRQPASGDTEVVARVVQLQNTHTFAKAGIMFRETPTDGSTDVILDVRPEGGLEFMTRPSTGAARTFIAGGTQPIAAWLKLTRTGSMFTAYASPNGSDWTLIGSTSVTMAANVSAGLAVTSHTTATLTTAVFDNVSVTSPGGGGGLPSPWQHQDVGTVSLGGNAAYNSGVFTVQGAGADIWGTADSFQFVYQPASSDLQITARVIGFANATNAHAKAGVMLRGALAGGAADVIADIQPDGSIEFMSRSSNGGATTFLAGAPTQSFPTWLRLTLSGSTATASISPNGQVWTVIGSTAVTGMTEAGLAVTSHNSSTLATATLDNVTVTTGTGQPPPSPWTNQDIGIVGLAGSAAYSAGAFTISAAGADIWGTADSFNFTSQPFSGDGQIVARVTRPEDTNTFAKAGVMFRETLTAGSIEVVLDLRPAGDIEFMTRATTGGATSFIAGSTTATSQIWLELARSGATFTAFKSTDGVTWMQIGATSVTMTDNANAGLAVTSHNTATRTTASIDSVSVTSSGAGAPPRTPSAPTPASAATNVGTTPTLTWSDSAATSYDVAFGTTNPPPTASAGQSSASYTPTTLANETTYYWQVVAHNANGTALGPLWLFTTAAATSGGGLPAPWADHDVGSVGSTGTASYASGAFIVMGAGADIGGTSDAFNFLHRPLTGDGQITARITGVQNTNAAARAGVMLRETLNPDAASVLIDLRPSGALDVLARTSTGSTTITLATEPELMSFPMWVRLARSGSTVVAYVSQEGGSWTAVATTTVSLASSVDVGLAVTSDTTSALSASVFDNVSVGAVSIPAPPALSFTRKVLATGGAGSGTAIGITGFTGPTSVTLGPDGKLYVATVDGRIYILTLDQTTLMQPGQVSVTHVQEIDAIYLKPSIICDSTGANCQLQGNSIGRQVTGITIDPRSTSTNIILYVSNSNLGQPVTDITVYTYSGTITQLVLHPDAGNPGNYLVQSNQDLVSGLPRSRESHSVNGLSIGPDGWLYLAIGSNTNAGAPTERFLNLPEYYLSASVVRLNLAALPAGPIDVTNVRAASDMSPWHDVFELYATGYRNPYDLVWHSNGKLYLNVNNSNLTEGPTPGPGDGCSSTPSIDIGTPPDGLFVVTHGAHGGHPNPQRGQCVWGDAMTHYWPDGTMYSPPLPADAGYTPPIAEYVRDAGDSTDGIVEYKSNAFGGAMQHNLISASFDGDDNIRRIVLTPDGSAVQAIYLLGQFDEPLDVWTDVRGNIYVVEFGSNQITMLIPAQPGS